MDKDKDNNKDNEGFKKDNRNKKTNMTKDSLFQTLILLELKSKLINNKKNHHQIAKQNFLKSEKDHSNKSKTIMPSFSESQNKINNEICINDDFANFKATKEDIDLVNSLFEAYLCDFSKSKD